MIDTKALRSRILDLAIQGKLTEQLPGDGTAEELYQQIQAEKQALIKEGKIKKEKLLPEISADEIPFEIPSNWKWVRIIEIGVTVTGSTPSKKQTDNYGGKYPFFKPADLDNGIHITKASEYLSDIGKSNSRQLKKGTILVCCIGSLGKCAIIETDGTCNQQINAFTPYTCSSEYLYFAISNSFFTSQLNQVSRATTLEIVNKSKFDNCIIPLPPLAEQKRIVERVEEIFRLLDTIDQAQEKYSADSQILKAKLITAGIQGKLTKQLPSDGSAQELYQQIQAEKQKLIKEGKLKKEKPLPPVSPEEVPFEIPENWMWVRLGDVYGFNPPTEADGNMEAAFIPMERISAGYSREFSFEVQDWEHASKNHTKFVDGDVAFAKITPCFENRKSFIAEGLPNSIGGGTTELIILRQKLINPAYTYLLIIEQRFIDAGVSTYKGTAGQQRVKNDAMKQYLIPLPPLAEQKRIADVLERALEVLDKE